MKVSILEKKVKRVDCQKSKNLKIMISNNLRVQERKINERNQKKRKTIIRNRSSYNLLNDLIKVCAKIFMKYNIIENDKICYLDKFVCDKGNFLLNQIMNIDASIIVINDRKFELDNLNRIIKQSKNKVFIFEDTNYCEGETDGELGKLSPFRMTINKISLDDKIMYCKSTLNVIFITLKCFFPKQNNSKHLCIIKMLNSFPRYDKINTH